MTQTEPGLYDHYKGGVYTVLFLALNSTNGGLDEDKPVVIYVSHKTGQIRCRLEEEFHETVVWSAQKGEGEPTPVTGPRFKKRRSAS